MSHLPTWVATGRGQRPARAAVHIEVPVILAKLLPPEGQIL